METDRTFTSLIAPLYDNLYGAAMRLTRDPTEAEDLTQDTMVRAWRFQDTYQRGTNIKAWLFTILRNTFINGYHKAGRRSAGLSEVADHMQALGEGVAVAQCARGQHDAESSLDVEAKRESVRREVEALPEDYRVAVTLADFEGLSYQEIADVVGCPIGTVMSRVYRGRRRLAARLSEYRAAA